MTNHELICHFEMATTCDLFLLFMTNATSSILNHFYYGRNPLILHESRPREFEFIDDDSVLKAFDFPIPTYHRWLYHMNPKCLLVLTIKYGIC